MTDWRHGSVFDKSSAGNAARNIRSILLNGTGDVTQFGQQQNTSQIPEPYTLVFDNEKDEPELGPRPKRYLLRLINTSIGSTFIFSIDNHYLSIVSADFVPIYPYLNTSVLIGIGQRYNVIVEAKPRSGPAQPLEENGNYWIRTWVADKCGPGVGASKSETYMQTGILRYNADSTDKPTSKAWNGISFACSDETYTSLRPVLPWIVEDPINEVTGGVGFQQMAVVQGSPSNNTFPVARLAFQNVTGQVSDFTPLQINFSDPVFLNLDNPYNTPNRLWEIYPEGRNGQADWVWLAITVDTIKGTETKAHPVSVSSDYLKMDPRGRSILTLSTDTPPRS